MSGFGQMFRNVMFVKVGQQYLQRRYGTDIPFGIASATEGVAGSKGLSLFPETRDMGVQTEDPHLAKQVRELHQTRRSPSVSSGRSTKVDASTSTDEYLNREADKTVRQLRGHAWEALAMSQELGSKEDSIKIERYLKDSLMAGANGTVRFNASTQFPAETIAAIEQAYTAHRGDTRDITSKSMLRGKKWQ